MSTQLWVIECPYCFQELSTERPPCRYCGVFWGPGDCKVYQAGPPGSHPPVENGWYNDAEMEAYFAREAIYRREVRELDDIADRLWAALLKGGL